MCDMLYVDDDNFIWYGDFRLPLRIDVEREVFEFCDKDRRRSAERGTRMVEVPLSQISSLCNIQETE